MLFLHPGACRPFGNSISELPVIQTDRRSDETEPWESIDFKVYKSQLPVIEQAIETAGLMLRSDKSRGYRLEMICADFLAVANLDNGNPDLLLRSALRFFEFLAGEQKQAFLNCVTGAVAS